MYNVSSSKIIELKDYLNRCEEVEKGFESQLKAQIISVNEVREKREKMKKNLEKLVLEIHPYSFNQMKGKDTRWYTSVKKEGEDRKIIKKNSYEELIDYLIDYYGVSDAKKKTTLRTMYPVWRKHKINSTKKMGTISRIESDWKKYYVDDPIVDVPLEKMTTNQISEWLNQRIIKDGVSKKKKFYNMITIFKNIFAYCYEEGLIPTNTFDRVRYRTELLEDDDKPNDETQVYCNEERQKLIALAYNKFKEDNTKTFYLGIPLMFQTALRRGELVALKASDYDKETKTLRVCRSECCDFKEDENGVIVSNSCYVGEPKKKASIRVIELTDEACYIIETIIKANKANGQYDEDYLFVCDNERVHAWIIHKRLYKMCDELGMDRRSSHKIRKTVLSELVDGCIKDNISDISAIRGMAGHVDESTLMRNYVFSTKKDEMRQLVGKTLTSDTWKHQETLLNENKKAESL